MARFLLLPAGSHGDVHPFVAIGRALRERGHRVTMITSEPFREVSTRQGLDFVPTLSAAEYQGLMDHPDLWHPTRGFSVILARGLLDKVLPLAYEAILERYEPGDTVAVAGTIALSARVANEVLGVPLATLHLQPASCASALDPPATPDGFDLGRLPGPVVRGILALADRFVLDPLFVPSLRAFRARFGLAPVRRVLSRWANSPACVIGLFPDWFGAVPDAGPAFRHGGFVFFDDAEARGVPPSLAEFLDAGPPPVVFSFGSAMRSGRRYFEAAVEACRIAGLRGVLLGRSGEQIPENLPAFVHHADYAPFSVVFPRAAVAVHHGGVGSTAQALRAGTPQLVMPIAYDQGDNASRARRLGVAGVLPAGRFTGRAVAKQLRGIVASAAAEKARAIAARLRGDDALGRVVAILEEQVGADGRRVEGSQPG